MEIDSTKLLKLRLHKKVSAEKVAHEVGVGKTTILFLESGRTKNPRFCTLWDICKYYDVSILSILKNP